LLGFTSPLSSVRPPLISLLCCLQYFNSTVNVNVNVNDDDDEPNTFVTPPEPSENKGEILEQGLDIEEGEDENSSDIEEGEDENNSSSHRLRRLPKVRDLRSVVTLKDLEEKSESVKSSSDIGTETQGEKEKSKEVEELVKRKDKSIMKHPSSEAVASNGIIIGSPKKKFRIFRKTYCNHRTSL